MCGAQTVGAGVSATQNDNVLAFCGDEALYRVPCLNVVTGSEIVHGVMDAQEVPSGNLKLSRDARTGGNDHRVVALVDFLPGYVHPDLNTRAETRPFSLHLSKSLIEVVFFHFEVGDAVAEQAADSVIALENRNCVAHPSELLSGSKTCWPTADDGDRLAAEAIGRDRLHPAVLPRIINDRHLDVFDCHRGLINPQHTRRLARCRTKPAREFGEIVGLVETLNCAFSIPTSDQVVPFGNQVTQWAALVTERDTTVHASTRLAGQRRRVSCSVDLFPVSDTNVDGPAGGKLPLGVLHKTARISHQLPPESDSTLPRHRGRVPLASPGHGCEALPESPEE